MFAALLEWIEPTARQRRKAIRDAAIAQLNHAPDAGQRLSEYAALTGRTRTEAQARVNEYLDDCLT
jgi:hypothetical protein